jgi:hypothetical protein
MKSTPINQLPMNRKEAPRQNSIPTDDTSDINLEDLVDRQRQPTDQTLELQQQINFLKDQLSSSNHVAARAVRAPIDNTPVNPPQTIIAPMLEISPSNIKDEGVITKSSVDMCLQWILNIDYKHVVFILVTLGIVYSEWFDTFLIGKLETSTAIKWLFYIKTLLAAFVILVSEGL